MLVGIQKFTDEAQMEKQQNGDCLHKSQRLIIWLIHGKIILCTEIRIQFKSNTLSPMHIFVAMLPMNITSVIVLLPCLIAFPTRRLMDTIPQIRRMAFGSASPRYEIAMIHHGSLLRSRFFQLVPVMP